MKTPINLWSIADSLWVYQHRKPHSKETVNTAPIKAKPLNMTLYHQRKNG